MTSTSSAAPIPPVYAGPLGKSALAGVRRNTTTVVKASVSNDFSSLDDFVVLARDPEISSGRLSGEGVVRHRDQMHTDEFLVEAEVGIKPSGKTRIVTCGSATFSSFYGLEVETGIINNKLHIIKGSGTTALLDGGIISEVDKYSTINRTVEIGDKVGVWFDRAAGMVRGYVNQSQVISLPVPKWEIPHGDGFRYWGVAQGVDLFLGFLNPGVEFTSITAEDV